MNADQIERMFIDSFKEEGVNEKFVEALRAKARLNGKKPEQLIVKDGLKTIWKGEV